VLAFIGVASAVLARHGVGQIPHAASKGQIDAVYNLYASPQAADLPVASPPGQQPAASTLTVKPLLESPASRCCLRKA